MIKLSQTFFLLIFKLRCAASFVKTRGGMELNFSSVAFAFSLTSSPCSLESFLKIDGLFYRTRILQWNFERQSSKILTDSCEMFFWNFCQLSIFIYITVRYFEKDRALQIVSVYGNKPNSLKRQCSERVWLEVEIFN